MKQNIVAVSLVGYIEMIFKRHSDSGTVAVNLLHDGQDGVGIGAIGNDIDSI